MDPKAPANAVIADIDRAPVNAAGLVEFSSDVYILRPLDGAESNGVALVDVLNRGRKMVLTGFNRGGTNDPATDGGPGRRLPDAARLHHRVGGLGIRHPPRGGPDRARPNAAPAWPSRFRRRRA